MQICICNFREKGEINLTVWPNAKFNKIESNFSAPSWDYVPGCWLLCGIISVDEWKVRLASFFNTDTSKNHVKEIFRTLRKKFRTIWQKIVIFSDSIMAAETCLWIQVKKISLFSFLFHVHMKSSIPFCRFRAYFHVLDTFQTNCISTVSRKTLNAFFVII